MHNNAAAVASDASGSSSSSCIQKKWRVFILFIALAIVANLHILVKCCTGSSMNHNSSAAIMSDAPPTFSGNNNTHTFETISTTVTKSGMFLHDKSQLNY